MLSLRVGKEKEAAGRSKESAIPLILVVVQMCALVKPHGHISCT